MGLPDAFQDQSRTQVPPPNREGFSRLHGALPTQVGGVPLISMHAYKYRGAIAEHNG